MPGDIKETALAFLRAAASGKAREAFAAHAAPGCRHHNAYFAGDVDTIAKAMDDNAKMFPAKVLEVQRALRDGDLVAIHSRLLMTPQDIGVAVVHLFRFEGDKIAELWDVVMQVPEDSPNENGVF
jgi:predicted SnoaL-like aldol condensation-catalyzing enzyme